MSFRDTFPQSRQGNIFCADLIEHASIGVLASAFCWLSGFIVINIIISFILNPHDRFGECPVLKWSLSVMRGLLCSPPRLRSTWVFGGIG